VLEGSRFPRIHVKDPVAREKLQVLTRRPPAALAPHHHAARNGGCALWSGLGVRRLFAQGAGRGANGSRGDELDEVPSFHGVFPPRVDSMRRILTPSPRTRPTIVSVPPDPGAERRPV